jgi:hypothetical protein
MRSKASQKPSQAVARAVTYNYELRMTVEVRSSFPRQREKCAASVANATRPDLPMVLAEAASNESVASAANDREVDAEKVKTTEH